MTDLCKLHKLVWDFRNEMSNQWPTPGPMDSLRYAVTEVAEAMDAWLRLQRPDDKRNNQRESDILGELADCGIMLLTAIPESIVVEFSKGFNCHTYSMSLEELGNNVNYLLHCAVKHDIKHDIRYSLTLLTIIDISNYPGMDLEVEIKKRLERIGEKFGG